MMEGFVKNRYIGRTFILAGQGARERSVRMKFNVIGNIFKGKRVLLVDDSIVRGTTSKKLVELARQAGATKVRDCNTPVPLDINTLRIAITRAGVLCFSIATNSV
jgi:amidophosphoribosyltransferase